MSSSSLVLKTAKSHLTKIIEHIVVRKKKKLPIDSIVIKRKVSKEKRGMIKLKVQGKYLKLANMIKRKIKCENK
jgi:hypothetical protein